MFRSSLSVIFTALWFLLYPLGSYAYDDYDSSGYSSDDNYYSGGDSYYSNDDNYYSHQAYDDSPGYQRSNDDDDPYYSNRRSAQRAWQDDDNPYYRNRYNRSRASDDETPRRRQYRAKADYSSRLPSQISPPGEKLILIDPNVHAWGAYTPQGELIRAGQATAGSDWCEDLGRPCRTRAGSFRIFSLGDSDCISTKFPLPEGGAPMPYCMYFNGAEALHGSNELADANISHGCVRIHVNDAEWLRFNFATIGTRVVIKPY